MPTLYVTEPRSVVRRQGGSLIVTLDDEVADDNDSSQARSSRLIRVQPHRLELIGLVGPVHITSAATRLCFHHGIDIAWFTRTGRLQGRVVPKLSKTADLRQRQFRLAEDENGALELARRLVNGKIRNAIAMVRGIRSNRPGEPRLANAIREMAKIRSRLEHAESVDSLFGFEGDAARRYFDALRVAFSGPIGFDGRKRRPAPDPANALLSLGYVLLTNLAAGMLEARGLDPYVGFLHAVRSGKPSLALDLIEEMRHPIVDRFTLRYCNRRQVGPEHFEADGKGGVRLTNDEFKKLLTQWELYLQAPMAGVGTEQLTPREALVRQADRVADHLREVSSYTPLLLKGA